MVRAKPKSYAKDFFFIAQYLNQENLSMQDATTVLIWQMKLMQISKKFTIENLKLFLLKI